MRTEEIMETAKDQAGQKELIRAVATGAAGSPDGDGGAAMETIPVVVTGVTSFLGSALARELAARGYKVYGIARPHSPNKKVLDGVNAEILDLELGDLDRIGEYIKEPCQVFFHFGWDGSGSKGRQKADVQRKNVEDSIKALEGAKSLGCRRFVFSGSQAEYGICHTVMREDMECHPVSEYGKAKVEFGRRARELCAQWRQRGEGEMEYIHARIFSVYGPGDHPWSLINTCLDTFLKGGNMELGACTQQWNFLYIEDLLNGLLSLAFRGSPGDGDSVYNVAGDGSGTKCLKEFVEQIYDLCGRRGSRVYGKLPPNAEGPANLIPDISKIRNRTGWKPEISFEEGIKRMLEIKNAQKRCRCIVCGHSFQGRELLKLENMPASAQDIPDPGEADRDQGITLRLYQCRSCGLAQFDCEPVGYYRDVIRSGGYSTTMRELRTSQYRHLIETYGLEGKKFLEAGCGQGEFLDMLKDFPVKAFGVEHRKELVEKAVGRGLKVTEGFTETEDTILGQDGPYDVFLSFNFLEHQPEPGVMLECIRNNLTDSGMGLITVPSLEYILKYDGYYELIRDHIAYYTFDTLRTLLERHGFSVLEEEVVNRDTLSVIVKKTDGAGNMAPKGAALIDIGGLKASLCDIPRQIQELCLKLKEEGKTLAMWGAGHQGFTLAATTALKDHVRYILDSAPFKQGKVAPASHVPIVAPKEFEKDPVDVIFIAAPGYTEEIFGEIRKRFGHKVRVAALRSNQVEELS